MKTKPSPACPTCGSTDKSKLGEVCLARYVNCIGIDPWHRAPAAPAPEPDVEARLQHKGNHTHSTDCYACGYERGREDAAKEEK